MNKTSDVFIVTYKLSVLSFVCVLNNPVQFSKSYSKLITKCIWIKKTPSLSSRSEGPDRRLPSSDMTSFVHTFYITVLSIKTFFINKNRKKKKTRITSIIRTKNIQGKRTKTTVPLSSQIAGLLSFYFLWTRLNWL